MSEKTASTHGWIKESSNIFSAEQGPYTLGTPYMCAKKFYEVKVAC